jgi:hypothetical protein
MSGDEVLPEGLCIYCGASFADKGQGECPACSHELSAEDHHKGWDILNAGESALKEFLYELVRRAMQEKILELELDATPGIYLGNGRWHYPGPEG